MKTNDKKYQYTKGELIETGQPDFRSLNAQSGTLGIVSVANIYGYLGDNNARRILECWNACVGMDHPITEIDKLKGDLSVARERVEAKTKIVYYAHCIALYDTPQEIRDLNTLTSMGFDVIDPNCPTFQEGYKQTGMDYFKQYIAACDIVAFRALPDGRIPAGVYMEVQWAMSMGKTVFELPSGFSGRGMSRDETREYLEEIGQR